MKTLTQNSTISPPSSLGFHWWVTTPPILWFKLPMAFVLHIWQTHALPLHLYVPLADALTQCTVGKISQGRDYSEHKDVKV